MRDTGDVIKGDSQGGEEGEQYDEVEVTKLVDDVAKLGDVERLRSAVQAGQELLAETLKLDFFANLAGNEQAVQQPHGAKQSIGTVK